MSLERERPARSAGKAALRRAICSANVLLPRSRDSGSGFTTGLKAAQNSRWLRFIGRLQGVGVEVKPCSVIHSHLQLLPGGTPEVLGDFEHRRSSLGLLRPAESVCGFRPAGTGRLSFTFSQDLLLPRRRSVRREKTCVVRKTIHNGRTAQAVGSAARTITGLSPSTC